MLKLYFNNANLSDFCLQCMSRALYMYFVLCIKRVYFVVATDCWNVWR